MFTGIVSGIGRIVDVRALGGGAEFGNALRVEAPAGWLAGSAVGDSIAMNGACMTIVSLRNDGDTFDVEVSAESLAATHGLGAPGEINLEKSLRAGDRLDGHLVGGHVDGVGVVSRFERVGESWALRVEAPLALARFLAQKGSVAIDGVSLTVNRVVDAPAACEFAVNLIPHTVAHTSLRNLTRGARVNLEIDTIARYVERMLASGPAR
ncbi:MAG: riboflavin synthase [Caldimonas sp.]